MLYQTFTNPNEKSNFCKTRCIDKGLIYCPNADYQNGYCCKPGENCPREGVCTNDDPKAPDWFKYVLCPNEAECGNNYQKIIVPNLDSTPTIYSIYNDGFRFDRGDMCGYIIEAPAGMGKWDKLKLQVSNIKFADVYVAKSKGFRYFSHLDYKPTDLGEYDTKQGW